MLVRMARTSHVIYNGEGCKMPILAVIGIAETGEREVLAFSVGDRENEQAWKDLLEDLKQRGVKTIDLWVSDGNQAMINAITKKFPDSARQRCVVHKMDNVLSYVPTKQQEQLKPELKPCSSHLDRESADQAGGSFYREVSIHLSDSHPVFAAGSGGMSDLLRLPEGTLEDHSYQ